MDEGERDPVIATALADIEVPTATDAFWAALEQQLAVVDEHRATAPSADDAAVVPLAPATPARPSTRRRGWLLVAAAAAAVVVLVAVGIMLVRRTTTPIDTGPAATVPVIGTSPIDLVMTYRRTIDAGDRAGARALLGPRLAAEVEAGEPLPYDPAGIPPAPAETPNGSIPDDPTGSSGQTVWPDDWPIRARELALDNHWALVVIPAVDVVTYANGTVVRQASSHPYVLPVWREAPDAPWRLEGTALGPWPAGETRGAAGGVYQGNGVDLTMSVPEAGHTWVFVDGLLHAEHESPEKGEWAVPPVPPTSLTTSPGREVIVAFIGPTIALIDGTVYGQVG